ncbi:NifB/NifX family molybdenum-iron cluster-binding protein [Ancylomarina longa]|uniref:Dinitrogenase iron-molybdenum cofactor biosynthesis protein n=1 Tax=Ancylomarina longa TaxID=2487017 RepID=A0A434AV65_9BACT|nr:NifB/NifX family molybdenum-iron cluster-binding protein [Ancylomarina longa]RUT78249.1 dinitrogenase iron-molybdenum cofactor biosynthesis protein [Ancylomarina longa]
MKIAVPTRDNRVDGHFGHCEFYSIVTVNENREIESIEKMESPEGCGCKSNIASVFQQMGISLMLAGNIGPGAINKINEVGVEVVRGCSGEVEDVVNSYLKGNLIDSGITCSAHENHGGEGHQCQH